LFSSRDTAMSQRNGHANGHARNGTTPLPAEGNGDRDAKSGRFVAGNTAGKGNPVHRKLARNRSLLLTTVDEGELRELFRDLYRRARDGDNDAARIVISYLVGKPREVVSEDDNDADELGRLLESPGLGRLAAALLEGVSAGQALQLFRLALAAKETKTDL